MCSLLLINVHETPCVSALPILSSLLWKQLSLSWLAGILHAYFRTVQAGYSLAGYNCFLMSWLLLYHNDLDNFCLIHFSIVIHLSHNLQKLLNSILCPVGRFAFHFELASAGPQARMSKCTVRLTQC